MSVNRPGGDPKAIFIAALEHGAGEAREAFVEAACGDDVALRRRVEALLRAYERADRVLGAARAGHDAETVAEPAPSGGSPPPRPDEATLADAPPTADRPGSNGLSRGAVLRYFGDYEILGELGRGGMGAVYRARQVSLNRPVALKMIRSGLLACDDELRRFRNEAEAVALLDHPGIVPVYEAGEHEGQSYISMKLIEGDSLAAAPDRYRGDVRAAARIVAEAADAVAHAHARGLLHRDLKPANLLLDGEGRPHVTDFGLAKRLAEDVEMTRSGAILGTPAFMAPEQAAGRRGGITTATDVYGLGAVLYAMLAGKAPFGGDSVMDTLRAVKEQRPEPPTRFNARTPRDLETICLKCLEKDPCRRYPTAQALADDLRAWLERRPIVARRVGPAERLRLWCRRRPALAGLVAMLALSLVSATALAIAYARQQADRARAEQLLRAEAIKERDRSARQAYISSINLAWHEWQGANPARARELVEATRPADESAHDFRGFEWFFLDRLGRTSLWTYTAAESIGSSLAFDPGGAWVAATMWRRDRTANDIVVLDARTGKEVWKITSRGDGSGRIAASPDGRRLALADRDGTIVLHDTASGEERDRLAGAGALGGGSVIFSRDGRQLARVASGSGGPGPDHSLVELWDVPARRASSSLSVPAFVGALAFSPDGGRIAMAGDGLKIWDISAGKLERELDTGAGFIDVAYSPDGRTLAGATLGGWIGFWDVATGVRGRTLVGHRGEIHRIGFSPDGKRLVSAGLDRVIRIWDVATGDLHHEMRGHESRIFDVGFAPDGHRLASVGYHDGAVRLWDADGPQESIDLKDDRPSAAGMPTVGLAFSRDGRVVAAAQERGGLQAWDLALGTSLYRIDRTDVTGRGWIAIGAGSDVLAVRGDRGSILLRKASTGDVIRTLDESEGSQAAAVSPDGRFVVGSVRGGTIRIWEVATGRRVGSLEGHTQSVFRLAFSPDGARLASSGYDVRIWDFASRKEMLVYPGHSDPIADIAFHPDGQSVASTMFDPFRRGEIHLWDARTGRDLQVLRGHAGFVRRLAFLSDGRRLASLGDDGTLKFWDVLSGQETLSIQAHARSLALAVSPDGRRLATSGVDGAIRIWDSGGPTAPSPGAP